MIGCTLIRNGNHLNYPWKLCIEHMLDFCERVIVNCDPGIDNTLEDLLSLDNRVQVYTSKWDMSNTGDGRELAKQANESLAIAKIYNDPWVIYLQADEIIHENDAKLILDITKNADQYTNQIELYRTYFYQDIYHRLVDDEIWLGRIFRNGTHRVGGDGMYLIQDIPGKIIRSDINIYHYSRIGTEEEVNQRLRTLDRLFHPEETVESFGLYSFNKQAQNKRIINYNNQPPRGIKEFYVR